MKDQSKDHTIKDPQVLECVCENKFQDKRYGKDMRLHNPIKEKDGRQWRCTVCGKER